MLYLFLNIPNDVSDHVVFEGEYLVDVSSVGRVWEFLIKICKIVAQEFVKPEILHRYYTYING